MKQSMTQVVEVETSLSAVVTRADGTEVDLGVITSPYRDPLRNWVWKLAKQRDIRRRLSVSRHDMRRVYGARGLVL